MGQDLQSGEICHAGGTEKEELHLCPAWERGEKISVGCNSVLPKRRTALSTKLRYLKSNFSV